MRCSICGTSDAQYRNRSRLVLCRSCHEDTPSKVSREEFDRLYWESAAESVPLSTRNEFWSDYKTSTYRSVADYRTATSSPA